MPDMLGLTPGPSYVRDDPWRGQCHVVWQMAPSSMKYSPNLNAYIVGAAQPKIIEIVRMCVCCNYVEVVCTFYSGSGRPSWDT